MVELTTMQLVLGITAQLVGVIIATIKISHAIDKRFDDMKQELNGIRVIHVGDISAQRGRIDVLETRLNALESNVGRVEKSFSDVHGYLVEMGEFKPRR